MTNLWRINISPSAQQGVDPRAFCFERGLVGCGWGVEYSGAGLPWKHYESKATEIYYEAGDKGWWPAVNAIHNRMKIGDLVWSRNWDGVYFLGRVTGEWHYDDTGEHYRADIINFRTCEWHRIGVADKVPGAVRNSFSRGRVLQVVNSTTALAYSTKLLGLDSGDLELDNNIFGLISAGGIEDLVGLYVQSLGYLVVPSTCQRTTAFYEFVLRHRETGRKATIQVKAGTTPLDRDAYRELSDEVFLFTVSESYSGRNYSNVHCLSRETLESFARKNKHLLPETISMWL